MVATASLIALQASAFAQTAAQQQTQDDLHPTAPRASYTTPTRRPLYNQVSPQQFNASGDYNYGNVSGDASARGGIGH